MTILLGEKVQSNPTSEDSIGLEKDIPACRSEALVTRVLTNSLLFYAKGYWCSGPQHYKLSALTLLLSSMY